MVKGVHIVPPKALLQKREHGPAMLARMSGLQRAIVHAANTKSGGGFLFSGHHSNKDLLIISDFTTKGLPQELNPSPQLRHCAGLSSEPAAKLQGRILLSHFCQNAICRGT